MIGKLTGRIDNKSTDHVVLDVQGVGYLIYCSATTLARLPAHGATVALFTDLLVREDNLQLFGFPTLAEKEWHKLLTSVQGVGAKVALAIAGTLGPEGLNRAVTLGDINAVRAAPGVGPKLAQRLVVELKDKAPKIMALGAAGSAAAVAYDDAVIEPTSGTQAPGPAAALGGGAQAEALSALVNLGYSHSDAAAAILQVEGHETVEIIKSALRLLAPKG